MRQAALVVAMLILPAVAFAQPVSAEKLRIGQSARLVLSFPCQTTLRVTLLQYLDPARSNAGYRPRPGTRFVALLVRVKNVGKGGCGGPISQHAELVDSHGTVFGDDYEWPVMGPALANGVAPAKPGDSLTSFISYIIPRKVGRFREFRFGGSYETAIWLLR